MAAASLQRVAPGHDSATGRALGAVKARTATAVMGGIDQTRLLEMAASAVSAAAQAAGAVGAGVLMTGGCSISPLTPRANRAAQAALAAAVRAPGAGR